MIRISKTYHFSAGHQLVREDWSVEKNITVFGQCFNPHGHNYYVTVTLQGDTDNKTGMVLNYFDLNKIVKPVIERLDHEDLNEVLNTGLTTAEHIAAWIGSFVVQGVRDFPKNGSLRVKLYSVKVQETDKTSAVWFAP